MTSDGPDVAAELTSVILDTSWADGTPVGVLSTALAQRIAANVEVWLAARDAVTAPSAGTWKVEWAVEEKEEVDGDRDRIDDAARPRCARTHTLTVITGPSMVAMTTLTADTPIWLICVFLFFFGAGLGCILQVVVLVAQNAVSAAEIGTATSTTNYFREVGAALGIAVFGTIFTTRLAGNLQDVFAGGGSSAEEASNSTSTLDPQTLSRLPDVIRDGVFTAYADALAPVFW